MKVLRTTGIAAGLIAAGTLIGASLSTLASVYDWSTTPATNATADPNINWQEGQLPSSVNDSARAMMAAYAAYLADFSGGTGGTGNAYIKTMTQPMRAWSSVPFGLTFNRTNTGAATLQVDALSAKPLRIASGVDLVAGQLLTGTFYIAKYYSSTDEVILLGKSLIQASDFLPVAAGTLKANLTGSTATPADVTLASFFGAAPGASIPFSSLAGPGYPGQVIWLQAGACPSGWIAADGTAGSPDLRGAFIRGLDNGRGLDLGRTLASFQSDALASHTHSITDPGHSHGIKEAINSAAGGGVQVPNAGGTVVASTEAATTGITVNATGGSETRPKNVALLACYHT